MTPPWPERRAGRSAAVTGEGGREGVEAGIEVDAPHGLVVAALATPLRRGGRRGWTDADADQPVSMSASVLTGSVDVDLGTLVKRIDQGKCIGLVAGFVPQ